MEGDGRIFVGEGLNQRRRDRQHELHFFLLSQRHLGMSLIQRQEHAECEDANCLKRQKCVIGKSEHFVATGGRPAAHPVAPRGMAGEGK